MAEHDGSGRASRGGGDGVLWAAAFGLAGLLVVQAGRIGETPVDPEPPTPMSSALHADGFSVVAGRSGRGDDADPNEIVWVLDSQAEAMMVYEIEDARRGAILFREGANLRGLFAAARR